MARKRLIAFGLSGVAALACGAAALQTSPTRPVLIADFGRITFGMSCGASLPHNRDTDSCYSGRARFGGWPTVRMMLFGSGSVRFPASSPAIMRIIRTFSFSTW